MKRRRRTITHSYAEAFDCRYAGDVYSKVYKSHFACFNCRKTFKDSPDFSDHKCPECRQPMNDMGRDFKAPKRNDVKQWEKVRILFENGFIFDSCGCAGPGPRPCKLNEVDAFLANPPEAFWGREQALRAEASKRAATTKVQKRKK